MSDHAQTSESATTSLSFPWMTAINGGPIETFARARDACSNACLAWQEELVRFTTGRLQSDSELRQKLITCQNWSEVLELQQKWAASMTQDYMDEANRLVRLVSKYGTDVMSRPGSETQEKPQQDELHQAAE